MDEEKVRIVEESLRGHRQGSATARRRHLSIAADAVAKEHRLGLLGGGPPARFSPVSVAPEPPLMANITSAVPPAETMEVVLVNGRRLTVPAAIDPGVLGRLLEVLERR